MRAFVAGLAMLLSGCGGGDGFAPGKWQVDAWMESDAGSTKGNPQGHQTLMVDLSQEDARHPPREVFFSEFYHGIRNADVRFADGKIEGSFDQQRIDDIAGHKVPISGTYARDRFNVAFEYSAFGMKLRQVVEGRLVEPIG